MKQISKIWILSVMALLMVIFMPDDIFAEADIQGGTDEVRATQILPDIDYISGEDGWFKITIPKGATYAGLYVSEYTSFSDFNGGYDEDWNYQGKKICDGTYKVAFYTALLKDETTITFRVYTSKMDQCRFKVVYGGEKLKKTNPKLISWNQEYTYAAEWESNSYNINNKYYKFIAPKSGYIRLRASGSGWSKYNGYGDVSYRHGCRYELHFKDDTKLEPIIGHTPIWAINGEGNSSVYYVEQGMSYYIKAEIDGGAWCDIYDLQTAFIVEDIPVSEIRLNTTGMVMKKGSKYMLEPTVLPSNAVYPILKYSSSNEEVATIDSNGWITAKKAGKAIITVSSLDGSGIEKKCMVNVMENRRLNVGETVTLNNIKYRVKHTTTNGGIVEVYGVFDKNKKSYKVPNKIKVCNYSYNVEFIADKAFRHCKTATKITLGANIKSVGRMAFSNCKKLKTLVIKSKKLETVGKKCFTNIDHKVNIDTPKGKYKKYKKLFKIK
ncbi:leucine-rich repeat protein [Roseburia sp. BX1005]|uniref:Leucine-rich repeat protein n=1 Tax=Roseburia zhanii TaxID=2763064 RepID=A0A923RTN7_9FIRM|nr:leucine-rich repeat protein [Roseburia zhanii]MBC5714893.1 leucine-rich repeat protein [Roseburia zhanii]